MLRITPRCAYGDTIQSFGAFLALGLVERKLRKEFPSAFVERRMRVYYCAPDFGTEEDGTAVRLGPLEGVNAFEAFRVQRDDYAERCGLYPSRENVSLTLAVESERGMKQDAVEAFCREAVDEVRRDSWALEKLQEFSRLRQARSTIANAPGAVGANGVVAEEEEFISKTLSSLDPSNAQAITRGVRPASEWANPPNPPPPEHVLSRFGSDLRNRLDALVAGGVISSDGRAAVEDAVQLALGHVEAWDRIDRINARDKAR